MAREWQVEETDIHVPCGRDVDGPGIAGGRDVDGPGTAQHPAREDKKRIQYVAPPQS